MSQHIGGRLKAMRHRRTDAEAMTQTHSHPTVLRLPGRTCRGWLLALWICFVTLHALASTPARPNSSYAPQSADSISVGQLDDAEREAKLALRDSSTRPAALAALGAIRIRQRRYTEAAQFLNQALQLNPGLVEARVGLAEVYAGTGKPAQARAALKRILAANPDNPQGCFALARLEAKSGNFDASLSAAQPVLDQLRHSAEGILLLAEDYAGLKQKDSLAGLVHDWETAPDASPASSVAFSAILSKSGLAAQALEVLEKAKSSGQVSYEMAVALGGLYFSNGDLSQAFESYEAALTLNPACIDCLLHLAKIATQQQDSEKALAYLIKAKRLQPENPEVLFEFGKACLELDLPDDAIPALQKAVALRPGNDSYAYVLGSANVAKKQYDAAGKLFQALLAKHPDDPILNYAMGSLLYLEVKLDEAAKYLHRSVELQPNQTAAYYYLGLIAEGKGEDDQALTTLRDVLQRDPNYALAYEAVGKILVKQRKYPEAQQALEKAVALNPESVNAHYQLGILWGRTGRQSDADKELEIVNQLNAQEAKRLGMRLHILSPH
jgi:tetratricopeptide (TPR) repeat protein